MVVTLDYELKPREHLIEGVICDLETTGLNREEDKIITLGILIGDRAFIHQLTRPEYPRFKDFCIKKVQALPKPRYGYASHFEAAFLNIKEGWHDLTQYEEAQHNGEIPYYRQRLSAVTLSPFKDPEITGPQVPAYWKYWITHKKSRILFEIAWHCLNDLLRERQLIKTSKT